MQKKLRQYRKTHFVMTRQNGENVDPIGDSIPFDEETCAKDMLFQLAENDEPTDLSTLIIMQPHRESMIGSRVSLKG